jgi:uncharacterized protein YraI
MAIAMVQKGKPVETGMKIGSFGKRMDRRRALRLMMGVGATVVAGGVLAKGASATSGSTHFRTTSALNLRKTPSTSGQVLLVIPANTLVQSRYESSNGYNKVAYQGKVGWAFGQYLVSSNGGSDDPNVTWLGDAKTTAAVNFRYEPSTSGGVLVVIAAGKTVKISDWVENGYRYVDAQGATGWIYDQYLEPVEEEGPLYFKTTTAVNLRANPSTSAKVIKVVPAGKTVIDYDLVMSNGYRGVDYNGTVGWIYDAYLKKQ